MAEKNQIYWGIGIILALAILLSGGLGLFASGSTSVSRSVQTTASPGQTLTVTYTASGSGTFGISIVDTISGTGCAFSNGKTEYKDVILSDGSLSRTMQIVMPQSGSCILSGDYKVNSDNNVNFPTATITVSTGNDGGNECSSAQTKCDGTTYYTCSNNAWVSQGQVNGYCGYTSGTGNNNTDDNEDTEPAAFDLDKYTKWAAILDINKDGKKDGIDGLIIIILGIIGASLLIKLVGGK